MLYSTYSENAKDDYDCLENSKPLSKLKRELLGLLQSKTRFEEVLKILPENWESFTKIIPITSPEKAFYAFKNHNVYRCGAPIETHKIISWVCSANDTTPGYFQDFIKRNSEGDWETDSDMTEICQPTFHVDHKLIWLTENFVNGNQDFYNLFVYVLNEYVLENAYRISRFLE